ncbi:MAG: hypothetical protein ABI536_04930 [Gallionella sp.]
MKKMVAAFTIIAMLSVITAKADPLTLRTQTGYNLGWSVSYYQYQEPGLMSARGSKIGADLHATKVFENDLFIRGDLRVASGSVDYNSNGTGSASGEPDWYVEARGLIGKDWFINEAFVLSPYLGLGYRYLYNDGRGITSTGNGGYRRESNYFYLPVGIIQRVEMKDRARMEITLEYDHLLAGKQNTRLSDAGLGYSDVTNNQHSGYGLKLSVMYLKTNWAIGPYADYWNIAESESVLLYRYGSLYGLAWEPKNNTIEFGVKASHQF